MPQNPFSSLSLASDYARLVNRQIKAPDIAAPNILTTALPHRDPSRACALILSPHPDDECLTGAFPLRLRREDNWQIVNLCVTLGSDRMRQNERKHELAKACAVLGFDCLLPKENGLSNIAVAARENDAEWPEKVETIMAVFDALRPQAIFLPHAEDGHATHIGTHFLGMDALAKMPNDFSCVVALTEYWQPQPKPNTLIGLDAQTTATLLDALACHAGEVARNGYDRRFPAYLIDNVRRSERVLGQGQKAPAMDFGCLYSLGSWTNGKFALATHNQAIGAEESPNPYQYFGELAPRQKPSPSPRKQ